MAERPPEVLSSPYGEPTRLGSVLRVVGGCVVVAIVVGLGLWVSMQDDDGFTLPDRLAGRDAVDTDAALEKVPEGEREGLRAEMRDAAETFAEQLSDEHDGAEAVFRSYGSLAADGLVEGGTFIAQAVRDESDPLVVTPNPPGTPEFVSTQELMEDGDVTCVVLTIPSEPGPLSVSCQRTESELTVQVFALGPNGPGVDTVVDATNDVWEDLS